MAMNISGLGNTYNGINTNSKQYKALKEKGWLSGIMQNEAMMSPEERIIYETFGGRDTIIKNLMKQFDSEGDLLNANGVAGMDVTGKGTSWQQLTSVSEEYRQKMFDNVKKEFIQENGLSNGDTTKRSDIFKDYQLSVSKDKRLSGTWTLEQYEGQYRAAMYAAVKSANPNWKPGQKFDTMAKAMATAYTAPNIVNREFEEHGPRKILLTDITYIINGKAPRCYMSTIIDACTKELLSWVLSESLEIDFVLETVKQLIEKHGTDLSTETLIHSDQGSHYTSIKFIQLLKDNELRQSMSRRANCWDNAPQESFFGHMKDELDLSECYGYEEILNAVRDWTEYYNTERYQWDLARLSPVEYYQYLTTGIYPLIIPKAKGKNNQSEASL